MGFILTISKWFKLVDDFFFGDEEVGSYKKVFYSFMIGVPIFYTAIKILQISIS